MKKDFEKYERRGLPGGPNEMISYMTGSISTEGYKSDSPDKYNDFNLIPSGRITMEDVDFPVFGMDNLGNMAAMMPGMNYKFPGSMVFEIPMAQKGIEVPKREGVRENSDGTVSTHIMRTEFLPDKGWLVFPSLFQNQDGSWVDMSQESIENWMPVYEEALKRNEVIYFGDDKEGAINFGEGSWKKQRGGGLPMGQYGGDRTTALRNFMYDKKRNKPFAQNGKEVDASKTKYVGETDQGGYTIGVDVDRGDRQRSRSFSLEPSGDASYNRSVTTPKGSKSKSIDIVDGEGTKTITRTRNGETTERTKTLGEKRAEKLRNKYERRVNRVFTDPFPEVPNPNEGKYMLDFQFQMGGDTKASQDFLRNWYQNRVLFSPNEEITPEMRQALIDKVNIGPQAQSFPLIFNDAANENILGQSDTLNDAIYIKPNAPLETYLHELTHFAENNPYEQDIDAINYMASLRALTADMPETLDLLSDPRGGMMDERQEAEYITSPTETSARLMTIRERHSDILKPNKIVTKEDLNEIFKREEKLLQEGRPNLDLEQLYRMYGPNGILSILNEYVSAEPQENIYDLPAAQSGAELDTDRLRKGISYVESKDGLYMMNPESTATGLYGQRFSELENQSDLYSGTREEFAKDLDAQDKIFDLRISGGIPGTPGLEQSAYDLTDEYSTQLGNDFDYTADETAALINFLGRQGTRVYFGNVLRDGMSLQEALPNLYSGDAKQSNKTPEEYIEEYREAVKKQGGESRLLPKAQRGFEIGEDANLTDFVITDADLKTLNAETYDDKGNNTNPYFCDPEKGCLASSFDAYDLVVGQRHSQFPTEYAMKGQAQLQSASGLTYDVDTDQFYEQSSPIAKGSGMDQWIRDIPYFKNQDAKKPYDFTADSWDIHGVLVDQGGTSLLTGANSFANLSSAERANLYKQMPPGTIVGYQNPYLDDADQRGYNLERGLANSTHSTIVIGYAEDGMPILYDYGEYRRLDDDSRFTYADVGTLTNITVPKSVAGKNIDYLKREGLYDMPITDFTANMSKVYEDSDRGAVRTISDRYEMKPFYNALQSNKNALMHDLKLTDEEYNSIAKSLIGIAMQETGGGTASEYELQDRGILGVDFIIPGASTHGLTQLNWDNIENDPQLKDIAAKYDITKPRDLMDPEKSAIASMIYGYRNLAVARRNYDRGVEPGVRTYKPGYGFKDAVRGVAQGATAKYPGPYFITEDNERINFEDQQTNYSPYGPVTSTFDRDIEDIQADFDRLYPAGGDGPTYRVKKQDGEIVVEKMTVGNAELTDEQKFIYNWNNPGALRSGDAGGLSNYLKNVEKYNKDLRYGGATNKDLSNYYSSLLRDI